MDEHLRPLRLLLLPEPLERFALRDEAERAMAAADVVAVDPPRISYGALARLPIGVAQGMAGRVARRLVRTLRRNGDRPVLLVIFDPVQVLHARAVVHLVPECELWYRRPDEPEGASSSVHARTRRAQLDEAGARLAARTLGPGDDLAAALAGRDDATRS